MNSVRCPHSDRLWAEIDPRVASQTWIQILGKLGKLGKLLEKFAQFAQTKSLAISLLKLSDREIFRKCFFHTIGSAGTEYLMGVAVTWLEQGSPLW